jgi:hypothetical protein
MIHGMRSACVFLTLVVLVAFGSVAHSEAVSGLASVQIVNATSVPSIALKINGRVVYENFPQGLMSADAPTSILQAIYEAEDTASGRRAESAQITYEPNTNQSLVILGDFSTDARNGVRRDSDASRKIEKKENAPNVLFQVFSHVATEPPVRLRIINGIPSKSLTFVHGRREIVVKSGDFAVLSRQPAIAQYLAKVEGEEISLLMRQEGWVRNAMIIFFLRNGRPAFMRAFENKSTQAPGAFEENGSGTEPDSP